MEFCNTTAERGVIGGLLRYGKDAYFEVNTIIDEGTFQVPAHRAIYRCLLDIFDGEDSPQIDSIAIELSARKLGLQDWISSEQEYGYLQALLELDVPFANVVKLAKKIKKLAIAKIKCQRHREAQEKYRQVTGDEPISEILAIGEAAVYEGDEIVQNDDKPRLIGGDSLRDYIKELKENEVDSIGINTGFPRWDHAIGGGLREGTVNCIGARLKEGKTHVSINIGLNIASKFGIPVLNLDTEMGIKDHTDRLLAKLTRIPISDIERGKIKGKEEDIERATEILNRTPYYHKSIAGVPFEEQISIMRSWIIREVGLKKDGTANKCCIIFDYLKLMNERGIGRSLQEYQLLGFMMTGLHNFAVKYKIPFVLFTQLNREGIKGESTDVVAGSDRILWLCSNFTVFKSKSDEEIAKDPLTNGNKKFVVLVSRHGPGVNGYINIKTDFRYGCVEEGPLLSQVQSDKKFQVQRVEIPIENE